MTDDPANRGVPDPSRVDLNEPHEVRYWTKEFAISEDELKRIVAKHGPSADAIRRIAKSQ